jgi:hypothetical protein
VYWLPCFLSNCPTRKPQKGLGNELCMWRIVKTCNGDSHLRSNDDHQAVAEHADAHHKISHGQPVPQPPNGPLVVVVAIEESRILDIALWDNKSGCSGFVSSEQMAKRHFHSSRDFCVRVLTWV